MTGRTATPCEGHKHSTTLGTTVCRECGRFIPDAEAKGRGASRSTQGQAEAEKYDRQEREAAAGLRCYECGEVGHADTRCPERHND